MKFFIFCLFLLSYTVSAQIVSDNNSSEYLLSEKDQWISEESPNDREIVSKKHTSSLNGKAELGGLMFVKASASLLLEFEQPIVNSNLMWLLQIGSGGLKAPQNHETTLCFMNCTIIPYALFYTGFKYESDLGLTASLTAGTRTFELGGIWTATSIGWNIMNKAHIELGLSALYIIPVMFTVSLSVPLKQF